MLEVAKHGRVKAEKRQQQCPISPSKTTGGLSERQRADILSLLMR